LRCPRTDVTSRWLWRRDPAYRRQVMAKRKINYYSNWTNTQVLITFPFYAKIKTKPNTCTLETHKSLVWWKEGVRKFTVVFAETCKHAFCTQAVVGVTFVQTAHCLLPTLTSVYAHSVPATSKSYCWPSNVFTWLYPVNVHVEEHSWSVHVRRPISHLLLSNQAWIYLWNNTASRCIYY